MGKATTKATAADTAAAATTNPVAETPTPVPTPEAVEPATVSIALYNEALSIAEAQNVKIAALESDLTDAKKTIAELEAEVDQANATIEALAAEPEPVDNADTDFDAEKTEFEYKGRVYVFKDHTPAALDFDGTLFTQCELLNDPEAMISLIVGENGFIKEKQ